MPSPSVLPRLTSACAIWVGTLYMSLAFSSDGFESVAYLLVSAFLTIPTLMEIQRR